MTPAALISCVVPAHNSERHLEYALASIRAQTWPEIEIIVVDDQSTPSSHGVLTTIARRHGARVERHARSGPAATRNFGVAHSRGRFVAFLDADDLWHPDKLRRQMACFDEDPTLTLCTTLIQIFHDVDAEGKPVLVPARAPLPGLLTTTLLAPRHIFDAVGPLAPDLWFSDSADWFLRAADLRLLLHQVDEALVFHRVHGANLSMRDSDAAAHEFLRVIKMSLERRRAAAADADH
jgi:glycosyltransferase involved in cell wall biosynthesis